MAKATQQYQQHNFAGVQFVYTRRIYNLGDAEMRTTAKVFRSGNSQAVRLPKQFRLKSNEVEIFRRGADIILRESEPNLERAFEIIANLPEDLEFPDRRRDPPQKRKGL